MKKNILFSLLLLALVVVGCKKDDSGNTTTPPVAEDWTFPADAATKLSMYCSKTSVAVNETFEVKVIVYNVTGIFGVATEIAYLSDKVEVTDVLAGPAFTPDADILVVKKIESASNLVSFGVTYKNGTGRALTGSGALLKLKCKGKAAGTATFTISAAPKTEARKADGTLATPTLGTPLNITVN